MKDFNTNTKNNDEWLTPPEIINSLGRFNLDPCAPVVRPWETADVHFTKLDDGLNRPWFGRVWLNKLSNHKRGIALIFARTETVGFHQQIWGKAHSVFFLKGRIRFHLVDGSRGGTANAPSCLVSYSEEDTDSIKNSGLSGKLLIVNEEDYNT